MFQHLHRHGLLRVAGKVQEGVEGVTADLFRLAMIRAVPPSRR